MRTIKETDGFTLIELLVAVAIAAILLSIAVPSFQDMMERNRLKGVAEEIYADLQYARTEAVKRNQQAFVAFQTGTNWCYGLNVGATCNCNTATNCTIDGLEKVVSYSGFPETNVTTNFTGHDTAFEPRRGASLDNGTITISGGGKSMKVIVSLLGRVRICSDDIAGYAGCP